MNRYTFSVRSQEAHRRIAQAATVLAAQHPNVSAQTNALASVQDKDPEMEQVKRMEAVADLLEKICGIVQPAPSPEPKPQPAPARVEPEKKARR